VYGWNGGRIRAIADDYAAAGYLVIIPQLLQPAFEGGTDGDGLPPGRGYRSAHNLCFISCPLYYIHIYCINIYIYTDFSFATQGASFGPYISQVKFDTVLLPKIELAIAIGQERGAARFGFLGFCWGETRSLYILLRGVGKFCLMICLNLL
jgi:dienelactone hydrolase